MSIRLPAGGLVISPVEAAYLIATEDEIVAWWRRNGIVPPQMVSVLAQMRAVAEMRAIAVDRATAAGISAPVSADFREVGSSPSVAAGLAWTDTEDAAERLGLTRRQVRNLLRSGSLAGRQRDGQGPWEVDAMALQAEVTRRREIAARTEGKSA